MTESLPYLALQVLQIIWLNVLLSGDNAVVIALACRNLPEGRRRLALVLGAGMAVALRIVFTALIAYLLDFPYLKLIGGLMLLYIAVQLVLDDSDDPSEIKAHGSIGGAVVTIMIADSVMSLDNVLAIAGVAEGRLGMIVFGLALSIPLVIFGANLVMGVIDRFPVLVWAGAGLLGWVAGQMIAQDARVAHWVKGFARVPESAFAVAGLALVLACAGAIRWLRRGTV